MQLKAFFVSIELLDQLQRAQTCFTENFIVNGERSE